MPLLLPFDLEWTEPFLERRGYRTNIAIANDGTELRGELRRRARRAYQFRIWAEGAEATQLEARLRAARAADVAVPCWPHERALTADAAIGAGSLAVDTTEAEFLAGATALLVRSAAVSELVTIDAVAAGSLTLAGVTVRAWPAGSRIIPCFTGRLGETHRLARPTPDTIVAELEATLAPLQFPVSTGVRGAAPTLFPFPTSLTRDPTEDLVGGFERFDPGTAGFSERLRWTEPAGVYELQLAFDSAAEVLDFWAWYDSVLGALTPFYVSSELDAFTLAAAVASTDTSITIEACDYTSTLFPVEAWRHLALESGSTWVHRRVTAAVDNADGTETLTLDDEAGAALLPGVHLLARMLLVRLEADDVELAWTDPDGAVVTLRVVELPEEAVASV